MGQLEGKVALVTGASRGIGRGCALAMAAEGADIVINYRSHPEDAQEVAAQVEQLGQSALLWQADVGQRDAMEAMFAGVVAHFGRLDIAVANAGFSIREPVLTAKWEHVLRVLEVAQFGVFHTCQLAAQQMVRQERRGRSAGKIIVISSIFAELAAPTSAAYNWQKPPSTIWQARWRRNWLNIISMSMSSTLAGSIRRGNATMPRRKRSVRVPSVCRGSGWVHQMTLGGL